MARGRAPCCDKAGLKKGPWSPAEDQRLISFIQQHGHDNWRALPKLAGLLRCGKSCRLRWVNYLRPDVKRGNLTKEEEETIIKSHESLGNKWSKIAAQLPGRTDNEIKNVWNTHLKKRLASKRSNDSGNETKESSTPSYSSSSSSYSSSADSSISCCKSTTQEKETQKPSDPKFNEGKQEHTTAMEEKTNSEDERMWLAYLESELGLHEQQSLAGNGVQQTEMMVSELEPTDIYFQMWPPSPPQF